MRSIGGPSKENVYGADVGADGTIALTGEFRETARFGFEGASPVELSASDGIDAYVAAYEPTGALRWVRAIQGLGAQSGYDVCACAGGRVRVIGLYDGGAAFGAGAAGEIELSPRIAPGTDGFVAGYAADGTPEWAVRLAGAAPSFAFGLARTNDGGVLALSMFRQDLTVSSGSRNLAAFLGYGVTTTLVFKLVP
jgi:hypothetical protein